MVSLETSLNIILEWPPGLVIAGTEQFGDVNVCFDFGKGGMNDILQHAAP